MKRLISYLVAFSTILLFTSSTSKTVTMNMLAGEPVPGAEIYVELEPDDEPIANGTTDENGEYIFQGLPGENPEIKVTVTLPNPSTSSLAQQYVDLNSLDAQVTVQASSQVLKTIPAKWPIGHGNVDTKLPSFNQKFSKSTAKSGIKICVRTTKKHAQLRQMLQALNRNNSVK